MFVKVIKTGEALRKDSQSLSTRPTVSVNTQGFSYTEKRDNLNIEGHIQVWSKERNHSKSRDVNVEGYKAETMVRPQGENLSIYLQTLLYFFLQLGNKW